MLSWKYLHVPPTPFLPPISPNHLYTIVLDLHETIVHFDLTTHVLKYRPGMDTFFRELKEMKFEIILFITNYVHDDTSDLSEAYL